MNIVDAIDRQIGEVRTDSIDMSIGELAALHESGELVIQPDFQRMFRWSEVKRSRLIESVLIQLPIPSIFTIENEEGRLELIDGLQRVSSAIQFIDGPRLSLAPLRLTGCDLVPELNGTVFEDLPLTLKLRIKRSGIRTVIIKRQSNPYLRYEMFKRLNSGGEKLSDQDIRNVNARMIPGGAEFYQFLMQCADNVSYKVTLESLSQTAIDARADQELVLRFFAAKNYRYCFKGSISDWLDEYMEAILLKKVEFDLDSERAQFEQLFEILADKFGEYAFVKYRGGSPIGSVAPAYFEAVTCGALESLDNLRQLKKSDAGAILSKTLESTEFRANTGPGANSQPKMKERIAIVARAFG